MYNYIFFREFPTNINMKVVVLGSTGASGQCVLTQALDAGHDVTVVVRTPAKVTTQHDKLTVK